MSTAPTETNTERKRARVHPAVSELTGDEMFESMTGFEEQAVKRAFAGSTVNALAKTDEMQMLRSLVFVDQKRQGLKDSEAHKAAQELTIGQVCDYFADDAEEPVAEDPVTEVGKDDSPRTVRLES